MPSERAVIGTARAHECAHAQAEGRAAAERHLAEERAAAGAELDRLRAHCEELARAKAEVQAEAALLAHRGRAHELGGGGTVDRRATRAAENERNGLAAAPAQVRFRGAVQRRCLGTEVSARAVGSAATAPHA